MFIFNSCCVLYVFSETEQDVKKDTEHDGLERSKKGSHGRQLIQEERSQTSHVCRPTVEYSRIQQYYSSRATILLSFASTYMGKNEHKNLAS